MGEEWSSILTSGLLYTRPEGKLLILAKRPPFEHFLPFPLPDSGKIHIHPGIGKEFENDVASYIPDKIPQIFHDCAHAVSEHRVVQRSPCRRSCSCVNW